MAKTHVVRIFYEPKYERIQSVEDKKTLPRRVSHGEVSISKFPAIFSCEQSEKVYKIVLICWNMYCFCFIIILFVLIKYLFLLFWKKVSNILIIEVIVFVIFICFEKWFQIFPLRFVLLFQVWVMFFFLILATYINSLNSLYDVWIWLYITL